MGDFHSSLNHMNRNIGSSGLRPGLGGNQQHMNNACGRRKGDEGGGKERKGKERKVSCLSSPNIVTRCGQTIRQAQEEIFFLP